MAEVITGAPGAATTMPHDLFVAHADADAAWVDGYLLPALGLPAGRVVTRADFRPGAAEVAQFGELVASSRYTVLVLTPAFLADAWSVYGEQLASHASVDGERGSVVPLVLQPCELPTHVAFRVRLDCTDEGRWDAEVARLRELLEAPEPAADEVPCPYPGMRPFSAADAPLFFGREDEVTDLAQRLRHLRFLAVIGPSGSGKSSLVLAGLLPELERLHGAGRPVRVLRPGSDPVAALAAALGVDPGAPPTPAVADGVTAPPEAPRLVVVDQLEEIFTLAAAPARAEFFAELAELRRAGSVTVIVTMRADFFGELMASTLWPVDQAERCEVPPLRGTALRLAIERPAAAVGVRVEPALVERLSADAADEPGALPLVQETLVLLWQARHRRLLTLAAYERLGRGGASGLAVALATTADGAVAALPEPQQDLARRIFLGLVQLGEGRHDTRRQQPVGALRAAGDDLELFDRTLAHLVARRLLTVSGDEGAARRVDLAHEALIAAWPRLRGWIETSRERLRFQRELAGDADAWVELGRDPGALYRGARLAAAVAWADANPAEPTALEREFVEASRTAEVGELEAARARAEHEVRVARRLRRVLTVLVLLLAVTAYVGNAAWSSSRKARAQSRLATSRQLAAQAVAEVGSRPDRGLLLAAQALATQPSAEAKDALLYALSEPPALAYLQTDGPTVAAVAVDPTGRLVAAGDRARQVALWDVEERRSVRLGAHDDHVSAVAFSPDGAVLASAGDDGAVRLWDVAGRREQADPLPRTDRDPVTSVAFGDGGRLLAVGASAGVEVWDVPSRRLVAGPFGGRQAAVAFSPDGRLLAAAGDGVLVWDALANRPVGGPLATGAPFAAVAFSPDGSVLAAASAEEIHFFDVAAQAEHEDDVLVGADDVRSLAWAPDGRLAAASFEGPVVVWAPETGEEVDELSLGAHNRAGSVAFSPDGATLVSGGSALILWDVDRDRVLTELVTGGEHEGAGILSGASPVAFAPDGSRIAAARHDAAAIVVDADGDPSPTELATRDGVAIAFEADGDTVAVLEGDGTISRWDAATGRRLGSTSLGPALRLGELAPGGRFAVVAAYEGGAEVWDVAARRPVGRPAGDVYAAGAAFSPDARRVAVATADQVVVWDVARRQPVGAPLAITPAAGPAADAISPLLGTAVSDPSADLSFSADGERLAVVTGNGDVFLFDVASGDGERVGTGANVQGIAISPDGRLLLWTGRDGVVAWDVSANQRIAGGNDRYYAQHMGPFDPAGSRLVITDDYGGLYVLHTAVPRWRSLACSVANRNLTIEEWRRYVGADEPYRRTCADHPPGAGAPEDAPATRYRG